jgi:tetratricopeptide (TPR) repeat protein
MHFGVAKPGSLHQDIAMSRIFLSHSSKNNDSAVALCNWLKAQGWDDVFLDLDPQRGIAAGDKWERSLNQAALRCEAVLFLVSRAWLSSDWCLKEFNLAHRLNKRLFGLLIEDIPIGELPATLTGTWQLVPLASGRDHILLRAVLPGSHDEAHVTFSQEGLTRLRIGLERAGLDAKFFTWPPRDDPRRPPYRGLLPLEGGDAGIFFGREAPTIEALDRIRGMKDGAAPRLLVLLGASGAGKSSFLRAGLLPRLTRDDRAYLPLPVVRPEYAAINGEAGLLRSLEAAFAEQNVSISRAEIRIAVEGGAPTLRPLLKSLIERAQKSLVTEDGNAKAPVVVLAIDQGEELFLTDGATESAGLLNLLRELLTEDAPALLAIITIRSDAYEQLQTAKALEGIVPQILSLAPMPRGAYQSVIEGPAARLKETDRPLVIQPALTQALLSDIEDGGGRDALPLLAFTLERLYLEYGARGSLTLEDYDALGRIKGSIEAAVGQAFVAADSDPRIPRDKDARLALLRRGLIPWLAGIDPDTGSPRRVKAQISEIPVEARPLIDLLVEQRLLSTDVSNDTGERTIEPAHEALLRQWGSLQGWLQEDFAVLTNLETVKRAARDWTANAKGEDWLSHRAGRLEDAGKLLLRHDLAGKLDETDREYLASCRERERIRARRSRYWVIAFAAAVLIVAQIGMLSVYLSVDSRISQARFYLKNERIEEAQRQLEALIKNPLTRVFSRGTSASALATELLDSELIESRFDVADWGTGAHSWALSGRLSQHDGVVVGLLTSESEQAPTQVVRCQNELRTCETVRLDGAWPEAVLLRDGNRHFVYSNKYTAKKEKIAEIGGLDGLKVSTIDLEHTPFSKPDPSSQRVWASTDFIWSSDYHIVFSESPAVPLAGAKADSKGPDSKSLGANAPFDGVFADGLSRDGPAECSADLGTCVLRLTDINKDARGQVKQFDVWGLRTVGGETASAKQWKLLKANFFEPAPSRNAMAVSANGELIAISKEKTINVWRAADLGTGDAHPWKSFQLAAEPLAVQFEADPNRLIVLSHVGIQWINLLPRSIASRNALPDNSSLAKEEQKGWLKENIDGTRNLLYEHNTVVLLDDRWSGSQLPFYRGARENPKISKSRDGRDSLISIYNPDANLTFLYKFPRNRAPLKLAAIPGTLVAWIFDGEGVITDLGHCHLQLYHIGTNAAPIEVAKADTTLEKCPSDWKMKTFSMGHDDEVLVYAPMDNPGFVAGFTKDRSGAITFNRVAEIGIGSGFFSGHGFHYISKDDVLTSFTMFDQVLQRRYKIEDLLPETEVPINKGNLQLTGDDYGHFAIFLGNAGCNAASDDDKAFVSTVLLTETHNDSTIDPQFLLKCIPSFPAKTSGFNSAPVMSSKDGNEAVLFGALSFPAFFEWKYGSRALQLYQFDTDPDPGEAGVFRRVDSRVENLGNRNTKIVSFPNLRIKHSRPSMTQIDYSSATNIAAFFSLTGRSAGNDSNLSLMDIKSKIIRVLNNGSKAFFDNMAGAELSPNGRLVVSVKYDTGVQLFRTSDGEMLTLPPGTTSAKFSSNTELSLTLANGAEIRWMVPEGDDQTFNFLKSYLAGYNIDTKRESSKAVSNDQLVEHLTVDWFEDWPSPYQSAAGIMRGEFALYANDPAKAVESFEEAVVQCRSTGQDCGLLGAALFERARAYRALGDKAAADRDFLDAALLGQDVLGYVHKSGQVLLHAKRFNDALASFESAIVLARRVNASSRDIAKILADRASANDAAGKFADAARDLRQAIALGHPYTAYELWSANAKLEMQEFDAGNFDKALQVGASNFAEVTPANRQSVYLSSVMTALNVLTSSIGVLYGQRQLTSKAKPTVTDCDRAASHPQDPFRVANPVDFSSIASEAAIEACTVAIEANQNEGRYFYQRARAFNKAADETVKNDNKEKSKSYDVAKVSDLEKATKLEYPSAFGAMAAAYSEGRGLVKDGKASIEFDLQAFNRAVECCASAVVRRWMTNESDNDQRTVRQASVELLVRAAELGSPDAHETLAQYILNGTFNTDPSATPAEATLLHAEIATKLFLAKGDVEGSQRSSVLAEQAKKRLTSDQVSATESLGEAFTRVPLSSLPRWLSR